MDIIDTTDFHKHGESCLRFLEQFEVKHRIRTINLNGIYFQTSDIFTLFHRILPSFPSLSNIHLSNTSIFDNDIEIIFHELFRHFQLETLDLSHNLIQGHSFQLVHHMLSGPFYLKDLCLDNNEIDCRGIINLSYFFNSFIFLEKFSISNNYIKDFGFQRFAIRIHYLRHLKHLDISHNKCSNETFLNILQNIPNKHLKYLNVSSLTGLETEQYLSFFTKFTIFTSHLCVALSRFCSIEVFIWNSYINQHIINAFYRLKELQVLEICQKFLYHGNFDHFPYLHNLQTIRVASISEKGVKAILNKMPSTLKELSFQYIYFHEKLCHLLIECIHRQENIRSIECSNCSITDKKFLTLIKAIPNKEQITSLKFAKNYIGRSKKFRRFASNFLSKFPNIRDICFYGNFISDDDFCHLVQKICQTRFHNPIRLSIYENVEFAYSNPFLKFLGFFQAVEKVLDRQYKWSKSCANLYDYMDSWQIFHHYVDVLYSQKKHIREYNEHLSFIQKKIQERKGYLQLSYYYSSPKVPYHPIFSTEDLQRYIFSFF